MPKKYPAKKKYAGKQKSAKADNHASESRRMIKLRIRKLEMQVSVLESYLYDNQRNADAEEEHLSSREA